MGTNSDMKLVKIEAYSLDSGYGVAGSAHCLVVTEDKKICWSNHGGDWNDSRTKTKVAENQAYWEWLMEFVPPDNDEKCGIVYGMNGLCHTFANRELLLGKNEVNVSKAPKNYVCVLFFGKYGMGLDELKQILKNSYNTTMKYYKDPYNALDEVLSRIDDTIDFELRAWRQVAIEYIGIPVDDIMAKNPEGGLATARARMRNFIDKREEVYQQHKSTDNDNDNVKIMQDNISKLIQTESDDYLEMLANRQYISNKDKEEYSQRIAEFLKGVRCYVTAQRDAYLATGQVPMDILLEDYI